MEDGAAPSPDARSVEDDLMSRHHAFRVISRVAAASRQRAEPSRGLLLRGVLITQDA
jgi:hypothetical protein